MNTVEISTIIQNTAKEMNCSISSAECDEFAQLIVELVNEHINEIINEGFTNVWNKYHKGGYTNED